MAENLFRSVVPESLLNPILVRMQGPSHEPARVTLQATYDALPNPDPHFVKEFQTGGFDARIWELYLFAYLRASGLTVRRPFDSPDFLASHDGLDVWVEAVTVNLLAYPAEKIPIRATLGLCEVWQHVKFSSEGIRALLLFLSRVVQVSQH